MKKLIFCLLILASLCSCNLNTENYYSAFEKAASFYKQAQYKKAIIIYNNILKQSPNLKIAHFNLASSFYQLKQYRQAISHYKKAGEDSLSLKNLANSYKKMGDENPQERKEYYKKALSSYKKAMILNEKDLKIKYNYELLEKLLSKLNQEKSNKEKNKKNKKQENKKENSSQNNQSKQSDQKKKKNQQNKEPKQKQSKNKNLNQDIKKQKNNSAEKKDDQKSNLNKDENSKRKKEILQLLKSLEKTEHEDFKNNQRIKRVNPKNNSKDW